MIADCGLRIADSARNRRGVRRALRIAVLLLPLTLHLGCSEPQANVPKPPAQTTGKADEPRKADTAITSNPPSDNSAEAGRLLPGVVPAIRNPQLPTGFAPVKIGILPLTELSGAAGANQQAKLSAFITMLDAFGSQVKAPGVLRFELYEYVPRSAQAKGPRLALWPDIDLTSPAENHKYWREFLRAYEFELDAQAGRDKTYVLEVTCLCPDGKRLSTEYTLRGSP